MAVKAPFSCLYFNERLKQTRLSDGALKQQRLQKHPRIRRYLVLYPFDVG